MTVRTHALNGTTYRFDGLVDLLAKATPKRSGDELAGCAASSAAERVAAQWALADEPLATFLNEEVVPYETDEVTRLIMDSHDPDAFAPVSSLTVGEFRNWLLDVATRPDSSAILTALAPGLTPEMAAAVSKLMSLQDLISVSGAVQVTSGFRTTLGLKGTLATRLQPNHPTDDPAGVSAAILDGLLLGSGDAVVGINPASDSPQASADLLYLIDDVRQRLDIPTQSCVLTHVTTTIGLIEAGVPVDLPFQSIAGTEKANTGFGVTLAILREADEAARSLRRGVVGDNVMYFETGQGSALSADAHNGGDQLTLEARIHAMARRWNPFQVNTVVGFIGPEYLYDSRQIARAGLEDHFMGKLAGVNMGCDVCYTNHAVADQNDNENLAVLFASAGGSFIMGVPMGDDAMLSYQTTSYHDAPSLRQALGLRPLPEFEAWMEGVGLWKDGQLTDKAGDASYLLKR